jgi:GTP cyclohydrolase I
MTRPALSLAPLDALELPDVQAEAPAVPLLLDEAGISDLRYPITVHLADGTSQATVASASIAASVAADVRGVHMSRFVELLHHWRNRIGVATLSPLLDDLGQRLSAQGVAASFDFPLFLERTGPVSGGGAFVAYDCSLHGRTGRRSTTGTLTTRVPVTSLCPCSREISDYGAHNQRGFVEISANFDHATAEVVDFTDLIGIAEQAASAPVYSLLKRTDERFVTMQAYENPAFVEDITRAVAAALQQDTRINAGRVHVVNEESIHNHNAYAAITWSR